MCPNILLFFFFSIYRHILFNLIFSQNLYEYVRLISQCLLYLDFFIKNLNWVAKIKMFWCLELYIKLTFVLLSTASFFIWFLPRLYYLREFATFRIYQGIHLLMNFKLCHRYATCYPNLINSQSYGNKSRLFDTPIFSARSAEVSGDPYLPSLAYFRLEFRTAISMKSFGYPALIKELWSTRGRSFAHKQTPSSGLRSDVSNARKRRDTQKPG